MNDRIQMILLTKDLTPAKFADEIGVQRSSVSHILSGRNGPSLDFIQKILARFPDISAEWMINGNGRMYPDETHNETVIIDQSSPDLFNQSSVHQEDKLIPASTPPPGMATKSSPEPQVNKEPTEAVVEKRETPPETGQGDIDQIVILYRDGSFSRFRPRD